MLTRNFYRVLGGVCGRALANSMEVTLTLPDGTVDTDTMLNNSADPFAVLGTIAYPTADSYYGGSTMGTWYGKGGTPATLDDYKLEDPITDKSISIVSGWINSLAKVEAADHYRISSVHQITNNTDKTIEIREVGCFGQLESSSRAFLLDRTVLKEPLVIPPKETVTTEYVIKFPYGT